MAQTTTSVNACDVVIALDEDGGTLTDISGSTNRVSLEFTINSGEQHTFEGDFPLRQTCGKDFSGTLTIIYSTAADEAWDLIKGWYHVYDCASRTMRIDIPQTGSGNDRYEGEVILNSYSFELGSDEAGPIVVECEIQSDGEMYLLEIGT